ncbi:MAG TPA: ferrochelatase [Candidatus Krumholzibacteria bacterium]|nr:ferrochelatase [Candidatus Krumholzibacteria bacterium]
MTTRHIVLLTYGEPPAPDYLPQLEYSWRILLGLTRTVAPIPKAVLPMIALARAYSRRKLWRAERYGSPLELVTRAQAAGLSSALTAVAPAVAWRVHVAYEFRDPLLTDLLDSLPADEPVDVVPMYVADSSFTHGISRMTIRDWERKRGARPAPVRIVPAMDEKEFADISAAFVARQLDERGIGGPDWALVLAAHGTLLDPRPGIETGRGATECVCAGVTEQLSERFGMVVNGWLNHKFGGRWTEPPVDDALARVAAAGFRRVVYFPYGFSSDNAESQLEGRLALRSQPGLEAVHLPCLNADPVFIARLSHQVAGEVATEPVLAI